jgi:hypothetical protein
MHPEERAAHVEYLDNSQVVLTCYSSADANHDTQNGRQYLPGQQQSR